MAEIKVSDRTAKYIDGLMETAGDEKASIANALMTAVGAKESPIDDDEEYANLCSVLGRYNRLLTLITGS